MEVLIAVLLKIQFSWDVTPCGASSSRRFVISRNSGIFRLVIFWEWNASGPLPPGASAFFKIFFYLKAEQVVSGTRESLWLRHISAVQSSLPHEQTTQVYHQVLPVSETYSLCFSDSNLINTSQACMLSFSYPCTDSNFSIVIINNL